MLCGATTQSADATPESKMPRDYFDYNFAAPRALFARRLALFCTL
jgi:hypothetical protein